MAWFLQSIPLAMRKNTFTIWGNCGEFFFLHLRFCQADNMFCHALDISVDSFSPLGLCHHASFLQGSMGLKLCMLILHSIVHPFIPPTGFWFPLVVLWETTNFACSIQLGALQLWANWLNVIRSVSLYGRDGGNCSYSSQSFYLEGRVEQARSNGMLNQLLSQTLHELWWTCVTLICIKMAPCASPVLSIQWGCLDAQKERYRWQFTRHLPMATSYFCPTTWWGYQQRKHQSSKLLSLCNGNPPTTNEFRHREPVIGKAIPCHDLTMSCHGMVRQCYTCFPKWRSQTLKQSYSWHNCRICSLSS